MQQAAAIALALSSEIKGKWAQSQGFVSLARFNINLATENSFLIQQAIDALYEDGVKSIGVPFVDGLIPIDGANSIFLRSGQSLHAIAPGKTGFKSVGTIGDNPTFPANGGAIVANAMHPDDAVVTNERFGRETGRVATASGASFNLTVTSGSVTAATVAVGGTGAKVGDDITIVSGAASCVLTVATVASHRGAVSTVTVKSSTANWGAPSNPYAMTSSTGRDPQDRIINPATMSSFNGVYGLIFDGQYGYGNTRLTGQKQRNAVGFRGALRAEIIGCQGYRTPNSAFSIRDCSIGWQEGNYTDDCGWTGVLEAGRFTDRNGYNNIGLYLTDASCRSLNTNLWRFLNNTARDTGDVSAQFAFCGGLLLDGLDSVGAGCIHIEGEASSYATSDRFSNNGGVVVPADATIRNVRMDGRMLNGHKARAGTGYLDAEDRDISYELISWTCGNEGELVLDNVRGNDCQNYALKHNQEFGGKYRGSNVVFRRVNIDPTTKATGAVEFFNIDEIEGKFEIYDKGSGRAVYARGRNTKFHVDVVTSEPSAATVGSDTGNAVEIDISNSNTVPSLRAKVKGDRLTTGLFSARVNGSSNSWRWDQIVIEAEGNNCNRHATSGSRRPMVDFPANGGTNNGDGNLRYKQLSISLKYEETTIVTPTATPLVNVSNKTDQAADSIIIAVDAPQFDHSTSRKLCTVAPTTAPAFVKAPSIGQVACSTTAATIAKAYREGQMFTVSGTNGSVKFTDVVLFNGAGVEVVRSGTGANSPPARTYTLSGANDIQLTLASSTSTVSAVPVAAF